MNVTSMLNDVPGDIDEGQKNESRISPLSLSRTPWDAGGYSLPIIQNRKPISVDSTIHCNDSPQQSPVELSSRHGLSDSRSSLSSFASASTSGTHSRFSSASTLSGFLSFAGIPTEFAEFAECTVTPKSSVGSPFSTSQLGSTVTSPQSGFLNPLAIVTEGPLHGEGHAEELPQITSGEMTNSRRVTMDRKAETEDSPGLFGRSKSPSDAMLIKRAAPNIASSPSDTPEPITDGFAMGPSYDIGLSENSSVRSLQNRSHQTRSHKRAISAPDFQALYPPQQEFRNNLPLAPIANPTPPLSHGLEQDQHKIIVTRASPNKTPEDTSFPGDQQPRCMFSEDCDTGSPPRKAISHIFGRNKMCTRLIPQHVWVHLCRKHYQRSRYRNLTLFAHNTQCELVQRQIQNLHEWSEDNISRGEGGVVVDWELAIRKREQKRLDSLANIRISASSRNRISGTTAESVEDLLHLVPSTAPPDWLRELCGKGYTTSNIKDILSRLQEEMMAGVVTTFPDIEILPNILIDDEQSKSVKGSTKRKSTLAVHQRSKSVGVGLQSNSQQEEHRISPHTMPSSIFREASTYHEYFSPSLKRKTYEDRDDERYASLEGQEMHGYSAGLNGLSTNYQTHRLLFSNDIYHTDEEDFGIHTGMSRCQHVVRSAAHMRPLPAPIPLRYNLRMVSHLEGPPKSSFRRHHRRSQSDLGAFRLTPPQEHPLHQSSHLSSPIECISAAHAAHESSPGHTRRRSSPAVTIGSLQSPRVGGLDESGSGYGARRQRNPLPLPLSTWRLKESSQSKSLYEERH